MTVLEQAKDTIRKLLDLAGSSTFDGEIKNALRFAHRLMAAHHLEEKDIHGRDAISEELKCVNECCSSNGVALAHWEKILATFVMKMIGSVCIYQEQTRYVRDQRDCLVKDKKGKPLRRACIRFYGLKEEVGAATNLYDRLSYTIVGMARLKYNGALRGPGRSYSEGFVRGLSSKLKEVEAEAITGASRALVVQSKEIALAKRENARRWLKNERGIKLSRARDYHSGGYHPDAFKEGMKDGVKADGSPHARRLRLK